MLLSCKWTIELIAMHWNRSSTASRPKTKVHLFSLTSVLSKGGVLSSDDQNSIAINQDGMKIVFD